MSIQTCDLPITRRENLLRSFSKNELWTPASTDYRLLSPKIIPDNVARGFVVEKNTINNDTEAGGPDMFNVVWEYVPLVGGSMVRAEGPQMLEDISNWEKIIQFPDIDKWDWEGSAADNEESYDPDRPTMMWFQTGLFERLISFMGFENAAVALVFDDEKPHVHAMFERLCDLYEEIFLRAQKCYNVDVLYFHDDWGGQHAPFFSQDTVREMILPYLKRLIDFVHDHGMYFTFHSCGKIEMLVPLMIEAGVDNWSGQPINDRLSLLKEYAGKFRMDAGLNVGFGETRSPEEVEQLTKVFLDTYGPYLGDIMLSNHIANQDGKDKLNELVYEYSRNIFAKNA